MMMLKSFCTKYKRDKSMTVFDETIEAEGLKDFCESVGKAAANFGKNVANNLLKD